MELSAVCFWIAVVAIISFLVFVSIKLGMVKSISQSDLLLKPPFAQLFEATLTICGLCLIHIGYNVSTDPMWLMIIGGMGIIGVAFFSRYELNRFYMYSHYVCAIIGFGATAVSFWVHLDQWYLSAVTGLATVLAIIFGKRKVLAAEIAVLIGIMLSIYLNL